MLKAFAPLVGAASLLTGGAAGVDAAPQPSAVILRVRDQKPGELIVRVFDVGQGQCVLIECPDAPPILNDCGKMGSGGQVDEAAASLRKRLSEYRAVYGAPFLRVVISHPHVDHYSILMGAKYRFDQRDIRSVHFGGEFIRFSDRGRDWLDAVSVTLTGHPYDGTCDAATGVSCLQPGQHAFPWDRLSCGRAEIDLLTANALLFHDAQGGEPPLEGSSPNGDSAMLRVRYGGASVVLPGDAEAVSQTYAARNAVEAGLPLFGTTILLSPHHGSQEHGSNSEAWVTDTAAATVVFSANEGGKYGHPHCVALQRHDEARYANGDEMVRADAPLALRCGLNSRDIKLRTFVHQFLVTETNGDVTVRIRPGRADVSCERGTPACRQARP